MAEGQRDTFREHIGNDYIGDGEFSDTNNYPILRSRRRRKSTRKNKKSHRKHHRVSFTTRDGRKVSFAPKTHRRQKSRRKSRSAKSMRATRKGKRPYPHWLKKYWFKKKR